MSDAEVAVLRNANYSAPGTTGWYVDLHDPATGLELLRAEGFLELQTNPVAFATGPN